MTSHDYLLTIDELDPDTIDTAYQQYQWEAVQAAWLASDRRLGRDEFIADACSEQWLFAPDGCFRCAAEDVEHEMGEPA